MRVSYCPFCGGSVTDAEPFTFGHFHSFLCDNCEVVVEIGIDDDKTKALKDEIDEQERTP